MNHFSQAVLRRALSLKPSSVNQPGYKAAQRALTAGVMDCAACGLHATTAHIDQLYKIEDALAGKNDAPTDRDFVIHSCFRAAPLDGDFAHTDTSHYQLLCLGCWIERFWMHPAGKAGGDFGMLSALSQREVMLLWRFWRQANAANAPGASHLADDYKFLYVRGTTQLKNGMKEYPGGSDVTHPGLAYFLANCPTNIYEKLPDMLGDMRFFPTHDPGYYRPYISLCEIVDPISEYSHLSRAA